MTPRKAIGRFEFIALMAALAALDAFSIDAMLPALSHISAYSYTDLSLTILVGAYPSVSVI